MEATQPSQTSLDNSVRLYLDLLKKCLTRQLFPETFRLPPRSDRTLKGFLYWRLEALLDLAGWGLLRKHAYDPAARYEGRDWPPDAETMVGMLRLDNLQDLLSDILVRRIPGDVIETGVWRGGASIFMRAVLKAHGDLDRIVWVADSFQGLPKPNARLYPKDEGDSLWTFSELAIPIETVKANFARYEMLDDNVRFLPGWFADTLPAAPIERLSLMRLDGDLYESTMDALRTLYPKLSPGGYVVIDDYRNLETCRAAVDDYRSQNGISEPIRQVDWTCVYWQRLQ